MEGFMIKCGQAVWIEQGTSIKISGLSIKRGGFYLVKSSPESREDCHKAMPFAIDRSERVLITEATFFLNHSMKSKPTYASRTGEERGGYLRWLSSDKLDHPACEGFWELYFSNLEYRSFIEKRADDDLIVTVLKLFQNFGTDFGRIPFVRWLLFTVFDRTIDDFEAVLAGLAEEKACPVGENETNLILTKLVKEGRPLSAEVAYLLSNPVREECRFRKEIRAGEFRDQFISRFKKEFPDEIYLSLPEAQNIIAYEGCLLRAYHREDREKLERLMELTVHGFTRYDQQLRVLDRIWKGIFEPLKHARLGSPSDSQRPALCVFRINEEQMRQVRSETEKVQTFLRDRLNESESPTSTPSILQIAKTEACRELQIGPKLRKLFIFIMRNSPVTFGDFSATARELGLLPLGAIQELNLWALQHCNVELILKSEPFELNQEIIKTLCKSLNSSGTP
jgi:hypothetical protein